jgi:hypothetical protein
MAVVWQNERRGSMVADRNLWLDKSESLVVEENDPRAHFLMMGKGRAIPEDYIARLNLVDVDGRVEQHFPEPEQAAEPAEEGDGKDSSDEG